MDSNDPRMYQLPEDLVIELAGVKIELSLAFGRVLPSEVPGLEQRLGVPLIEADLNVQRPGALPMLPPGWPLPAGPSPLLQPAANGQAAAKQEASRQGQARLAVAQQTINLYSSLRHSQVRNYSVETDTYDGDEAWRHEHETAPPPFRLTSGEQCLYDAALDFIAGFIENGLPADAP